MDELLAIGDFARMTLLSVRTLRRCQNLDDLSAGLNRFHIDFAAGGNLDAETERLVGLGATVVAKVAENGIRFTTLADPEGNKFDVTDE